MCTSYCITAGDIVHNIRPFNKDKYNHIGRIMYQTHIKCNILTVLPKLNIFSGQKEQLNFF